MQSYSDAHCINHIKAGLQLCDGGACLDTGTSANLFSHLLSSHPSFSSVVVPEGFWIISSFKHISFPPSLPAISLPVLKDDRVQFPHLIGGEIDPQSDKGTCTWFHKTKAEVGGPSVLEVWGMISLLGLWTVFLKGFYFDGIFLFSFFTGILNH